MKKKTLQRFRLMPDYLTILVYCYCDIGLGSKFSKSISEVSAILNLSKETINRFVEFCELNEVEASIVEEAEKKMLNINFAKRKPTAKANDKEAFYKRAEAIYDGFLNDITNTSYVFSPKERKSLIGILDYLRKSVKEQNHDDEHILATFSLLFKKYDKWDKFYQNSIKLSQILYNLPNIINNIRNENRNSKNGKKSGGDYNPAQLNDFIQATHQYSKSEQ